MEKKSCGAILYAFDPDGKLGIILGDEARNLGDEWLPFKGCSHDGETLEQAAIREIFEETCGLVSLNSITLYHKFSTKRKEYYIGLVEVPYKLIEIFGEVRRTETREDFMEKRKIKFFSFPDVLTDPNIHNISKSSILFYKDALEALAASKTHPLEQGARCLGISNQRAEVLKSKSDSPFASQSIDRMKKTPDHKNDSRSDYKSYDTRTGFLSRPKRFTISYTPRMEKLIEKDRDWRGLLGTTKM